ncbi:MAG: hypothetical protein RSD09_04495 [Bacilli bacterium]
MEEELVKQFENVVSTNKFIDIYFKREFIYNYVIANNSQNQLKEVKFKNTCALSELDCTGSFGNKTMTLYTTNSINKSLKKFKKTSVYQLTKEELLITNIEIIITILHELNHVYHDSIIKGDNIKEECIKKILTDNNNLLGNQYSKYDRRREESLKILKQLYTANEIDISHEYNAEMEANIYMNNIIQNNDIFNIIPNKDYIKSRINKYIDYAYRDKSIIERYVDITNQSLTDYDYKNLTPNERILYGFPASCEEIEKFIK